jgi:hypothetical protein
MSGLVSILAIGSEFLWVDCCGLRVAAKLATHDPQPTTMKLAEAKTKP